jgi:glycosyltransferase involved in cell wall biosynthesis
MRGYDAILVASHLRYDGVWQRPQQILTRFAREVPVLFIEEQFPSHEDRNEFTRHGNVTVLRPLRRRADYTQLDAATIQAAAVWLAGRRPLVWLYTPMLLGLADAFEHRPLVYDCMDELAAFRFAPPQMREREAQLLERADLVFTGGQSLYARRRALGDHVRLYPSGVEFEHFSRALTAEAHPLYRGLVRPVYGYFGVIDERIDYAILAALAESGASIVMVGPFAKIDPATLPRKTSLHFTGQVPYSELPRHLAGFDVAIMPFARNEATAFISPTKTPEYLAGGKPVVSTSIADVVARYGEVVRFADDPPAFVATCAAACRPDPQRFSRGIALARADGWDAIVAAMKADIDWTFFGRGALTMALPQDARV